MANTVWAGRNGTDDKLYLTSGQFSSTLKDSIASYQEPLDGCCDGTNTVQTDNIDDIIIYFSGIITTTQKSTASIAAIDTAPTGVSVGTSPNSNTNTPWCGGQADKHYLQSGKVTTTLKDSLSFTSVDTVPQGCGFDGTDTPWCGQSATKIYITSGQFTSTLKDSQALGDPRGIDAHDNTSDLLVCETTNDKLWHVSGKVTSTIKTSVDVTSVNPAPVGIDTDDVDGRLNVGAGGGHFAKLTGSVRLFSKVYGGPV